MPSKTSTKIEGTTDVPTPPSAFQQWLQNHLGACSPYLPVLCLLCEQVTTTSSADRLCPHCRLALPFNQNPCLHCALPLAALDNSNTAICSECLTKSLANRAIAPLIHRHEAAHLVRRLKFHRAAPEGITLAMLITTQIRLTDMSRLPTLLVPVPMAYPTAIDRSFNQKKALLAWLLAKALNIDFAPRLLVHQGKPAPHSLTRGQRLISAQFALRS